MIDKIRVARFCLVHERPYLAHALMALGLVESSSCPTMSVDQYWRLYYNPAWVAGLTIDNIKAVLYHEIQHLLREHHDRLLSYPQQVANLAADAEINDDIRDERMALPDGAVFPESFGSEAGELAEVYAEEITKNFPPSPMGGEPGANQASAGASPAPDNAQPQNNRESREAGAGDNAGSGKDGESQKPAGAGKPDGESATPADDGGVGDNGANSNGEPAPASSPSGSAGKNSVIDKLNDANPCKAGSGATKSPAGWELPKDDDNHPGISKEDAQVIIKQTADAIREYGKSPAGLKRWAEEKFAPSKVDWRKLLAKYIKGEIASGMTDYTYSRPSRRQQACGGNIILPSLYAPKTRIAVVMDTSGSINDKDLAEALGEVESIVKRQVASDLTVLATDWEVQSVSRNVRTAKQVAVKGGGGTDMTKGIRAAEKLTPKPSVIVVLTDGDSYWDNYHPRVPVIIVLLKGDRRDIPKWAKKVIKERSG